MKSSYKILISLFVTIIFIASPSFANTFCYQESVNITNQTGKDGNCGLSYTGGQWNISGNSSWFQYVYIYNGDWSDAGMARDASQMAYMWFNYTKPSQATSSSMIKYKGTGILTNFSIPITCWNAYSDRLVFCLNSTYPYWNRIECVQNASITSPNSTVIIANGTTGHNIYEEAMWWDIGGIIPTAPYWVSYSNTSIASTGYFTVVWSNASMKFIEGNFSGSFLNYTGDLSLSLTNGYYSWRGIANSTSDLWNTTPMSLFFLNYTGSPLSTPTMAGVFCYDDDTFGSFAVTVIGTNITNTTTYVHCPNGCQNNTCVQSSMDSFLIGLVFFVVIFAALMILKRTNSFFFKLLGILIIFILLLLIANSLTIVDTARTLIYLMIGMFGLVGLWYAFVE